MPQLHCYVPADIADAIRQRARARGLTVSQYLATLAAEDVGTGWPADYFEAVFGGWQGDPLVRPPQGPYEERESL
jgi:hypothetical protein